MDIVQAQQQMDISPDDREYIHDEMAVTTLKHITASDGLFEPLPYAPHVYPSQQLETVRLQPTPTCRGDIEFLAAMAGPLLFPAIQEALAQQTDIRDHALKLLRQGEHVFPVTNHAQLADIAIWSGAWSAYLEEAEPTHWQDHNGLVIARGVTTIGVHDPRTEKPAAASELIREGGHVFMSFPRTQTTDSLDLPVDIVSENNGHMRWQVHRWLDQRSEPSSALAGRNLNMAWSGRTDTIDYGGNHQPKHFTLGSVNSRTVSILSRGWVLPIVLWADDERQQAVLGDITRVEPVQVANRVQRWQGDTLASILGIKPDAVAIAT